MANTLIGRKRIRKFFGKIQEVAEMPNLIEVQKASYDQFLQIDYTVEQRMAALDVPEEGIVGDRDQLQGMLPLQPQRVKRRAPRQPLEPFGQALGERQPLAAALADQPLARFDAVGRGVLRRRVGHAPFSARMLSA